MRAVPSAIAIVMFPFVICSAQITGPEQDCIGAIPLCNLVYTQTSSYQGSGTVEDIQDGTSCLEVEENNSVWFTFEIADSGILEFTIASIGGPGDTIDYDFSLFNITGKTCADIYNGGLEVRCNYAFSNILTGLRTGDTATIAGSTGPPFLAPLAVTLGQTFALLVDNFSFASTPFGFVLDFSAGTTSFAVPPSPALTVSNSQSANDSVIEVQLSSAIQCASIAADGSDFSITGASSISVTGASGADCNTDSFTQTVLLHYTGQLLDGQTYTLTSQTGTDSNSLLTMCAEEVLTSTDFVASDSLISSSVQVFNDAEIQLFPNPTSGKVIIKTDVSFASPCHIEVVDVFGKQVYSEVIPLPGGQMELNFSKLARGVYFIRMSDRESRATRRFIITG